jgi:hypothetical protein
MAGAGSSPEPASGPGGAGGRSRGELSERERRRIAEVFGEVLPATTSDERDDREDTGDRGADDSRFLADRPPHHDRER